jgi:hypothetical protein
MRITADGVGEESSSRFKKCRCWPKLIPCSILVTASPTRGAAGRGYFSFGYNAGMGVV